MRIKKNTFSINKKNEYWIYNLLFIDKIFYILKKNFPISIKLYNLILIVIASKTILLILILINVMNINFGKRNDIFNLIQSDLNSNFPYKINNKINLGIYTYRIKDGGRARITSILLNYLNNIKFFNINLFTVLKKEDNEYLIPKGIRRTNIKKNIIKEIRKKKIHILIYELESDKEIDILNNMKNIKVIFYQHTSSFDWIYDNYTTFKKLYKAFKNSKNVLSIVPFDHHYLFKKWGIRSIYLNNFMTYDYHSIIPTDFASKIILMIGRGDAKKKRFHIGIQAMEYIIKELPECELKIISDLTRINKIQKLVKNLNLENFIKFMGYKSSPDIYFKNASLILFPSISEAFPMVLCETKMYGIPNILLGLSYITVSKEGTFIIYDDSPESLSKESIKLLKDKKLMEKVGFEARKSMKKFNNQLLLSQWIHFILGIFSGENYFQKFKEKEKKINEHNLLDIINKQIKLLKMREKRFNNITINDFENFTYLEDLI